MARLAVVAIAIGLLLAAASCGGSDDPPAREPARDLRDLEQTGIDKATKAQIEAFARIRIPASATALRLSSRSAMDTQLLVSFRLPAADLDAFVSSADFSRKLVDNDRAISSGVGTEIGWRLNEAERVKGLAETTTGRYRNLVVVLDDPRRPAVYLEAGTL